MGCGAGKYKEVNGSNACSLCSYGKFSTVIGAASSTVCASCPHQRPFSFEGSSNSTACHLPDLTNITLETIAVHAVCLTEVNVSQDSCNNDTDCGGEGRGSCLNGTCVCTPPFAGVACSRCTEGHTGEDCETSCTCSIHGRCKRGGGCVCSKGWTGGAGRGWTTSSTASTTGSRR